MCNNGIITALENGNTKSAMELLRIESTEEKQLLYYRVAIAEKLFHEERIDFETYIKELRTIAKAVRACL